MNDLGKMSEKENKGLVDTIITTNPKVKDANEVCQQNDKDHSEGTETKDANFGRKTHLYSEKMLSKALRRHFITIPQSEQTLHELYDQLNQNTKHLKYLLISQEQHADGGQHYHIMLLLKQPNTKKSVHKNIMKVDGNIGGSINYQAVESIAKSETYIKKDGTYLEGGEKKTQKYKKDSQETNKDLNEIYTNDKTVEENLKIIRERQPAYYTIHSEKIKNRLQKKIMEDKPKLRWNLRPSP